MVIRPNRLRAAGFLDNKTGPVSISTVMRRLFCFRSARELGFPVHIDAETGNIRTGCKQIRSPGQKPMAERPSPPGPNELEKKITPLFRPWPIRHKYGLIRHKVPLALLTFMHDHV